MYVNKITPNQNELPTWKAQINNTKNGAKNNYDSYPFSL